MKKTLIGLFLLSTICFADKIKLISYRSEYHVEEKVNEFIKDKKIKSIDIRVFKDEDGYVYHNAWIVYED